MQDARTAFDEAVARGLYEAQSLRVVDRDTAELNEALGVA